MRIDLFCLFDNGLSRQYAWLCIAFCDLRKHVYLTNVHILLCIIQCHFVLFGHALLLFVRGAKLRNECISVVSGQWEHTGYP